MEFEVSKELMSKQLEVLEKVKAKGKIKIGVNEVTKAIEREKAKFVFIAKDVSPKEIVMHLPLICEDKNIPYSFVDKKEDLGKKAGIEVGTSAIAIIEEGPLRKEVHDLAKKISELNPKIKVKELKD